MTQKPVKNILVAVGCLYRKKPSNNSRASDWDYEFLLLKRFDKHIRELNDKWELPGGKVERFESPEDTVQREFLEETGYVVKVIDELTRYYTYTREYPEYILRVTLTCYPCKFVSKAEDKIQYSEKFGEKKWFSVNDINFKKTLQGSREFIVDVAKSLGLSIDASVEKCTYHAEFRVLRPNTKKAKERLGRFYTVTIQFNPKSNEYYLITHRSGKIRIDLQPKIEDFPDYKKMISKVKSRLRSRHYHGYSLTKYDEDFPLLEWMEEREFPIDLGARDGNQTFQIPMDI